jgi:hypothetical protein
MRQRPVSADPGGVTSTPDLISAGTPPSSLFLVELRAAIGVPTDLNRMHQDLTSAIARLRDRGVDIQRAGSLHLPDDARCLCLVRGGDRATVALACDAAGLTAAPVYEAHCLPAPAPPAHHTAYPPQEKDP